MISVRFSRLILGGALLAALSLSQVPSVHADVYSDIRSRIVVQLTGGAGLDATNPAVATLINDLEVKVASNGASRNPTTGTGYWDKLITASNRTYLWSDLPLTAASEGQPICENYRRLYAMALALKVKGSSLSGSTSVANQLKADIVSALALLNQLYYNKNSSQKGNWYFWRLAIPTELNRITALLYDDLAPAAIRNHTDAVFKWTNVPFDTGTNRMWSAQIAAYAAVLQATDSVATNKSSVVIANCHTGIKELFPNVDAPDQGFYKDGSFVFHGNHVYNGGYGLALLTSVIPYVQAFAGTSYDLKTSYGTDGYLVDNLFSWLRNSLDPFVYRGEMMDMVRGRDISRYFALSHSAGREYVGNLLKAAEFASSADALYFRRSAKYLLTTDTTFSSTTASLGFYEAALALQTLNDAAITSRGPLALHRNYPAIARTVHHRSTWGAGLALYSETIRNYEIINKGTPKNLPRVRRAKKRAKRARLRSSRVAGGGLNQRGKASLRCGGERSQTASRCSWPTRRALCSRFVKAMAAWTRFSPI